MKASERAALSRRVGLAIHFTRNKALLLPSIRKLGLASHNSLLPPEILQFFNVGRRQLGDVPYRDEPGQSQAFQHEVYPILNMWIKYHGTHLTTLEVIAPYRWKSLEAASARGSGDGGFGRRASDAVTRIVIHLQEDKKNLVAQTKSQKPGAKSLLETLLSLADEGAGYSKTRVAEGKTGLDKFVRQVSRSVAIM